MATTADNLTNLIGIATHFGIPTSFVKKAALAGSIPCLQIGSRMLFNVEAVKKALEDMAAASVGNGSAVAGGKRRQEGARE